MSSDSIRGARLSILLSLSSLSPDGKEARGRGKCAPPLPVVFQLTSWCEVVKEKAPSQQILLAPGVKEEETHTLLMVLKNLALSVGLGG